MILTEVVQEINIFKYLKFFGIQLSLDSKI